MTQRIVCVVCLAFLIGCGGSTATEDDGVDDSPSGTAGEEVVESEADASDAEPAPEPEPEPEAVGPGQITVINRVGGRDAHGTVQILSTSGEVVAEGESGRTFSVGSGSYRVVGHITDAAVLIDTPTREAEGMAVVQAGRVTETEIDFPVSHILVRVARGGRPVARWRLEVQREGPEPGETIVLTPTESHVPITPGRYSGTLSSGSTQTEVNGLIFQGGARMNVPVNLN